MAQRNLNLKSLLPIPSLKDMALSAIKEALLSKKLEPGIMYAEAALSSELGISRTPVREALIHLASRGLVIYIPRRGFQIKSLSEKDVQDLFELRIALELTVIRRITPALEPEAIQKIEELSFKYETIAKSGNPVKTVNADRQLHLYLAHLTDNPYLIKSIEEIRDFIDLANIKSLEFEYRKAEAMREHQEIVKVLKTRSVAGALSKMEEHIKVTEQRILFQIRSMNV